MATPIGHLGDITLRALETLAGVDIIACEDTRITRRLTERYAISAQLKALSRAQRRAGAAENPGAAGAGRLDRPGLGCRHALDLRSRLQAGARGLRRRPCSDRACREPSSVLSALSVAALPTDRFFFEGFLPAKEHARRTPARRARRIDATLVMFESGNRVQDTLRRSRRHHGRARRRDLPRTDENCMRRSSARRSPSWREAADTLETRGEFVLVIGPPPADAQSHGGGRARRSVAIIAATRQRQGCGGACGRTVGPAAPRSLCPRARARQGS